MSRRIERIAGPGWFLYPGSQLERTAIHEAAHAVMGELHGLQVSTASIVPSSERLGYCVVNDKPERAWFGPADSQTPEMRAAAAIYCRRQIQVYLAGPLAQTRVTHRPISWGTDGPRAAFIGHLLLGLDWRGLHRYLRQQETEVVELLKSPRVWRTVAALARELQFRGSIRFPPGRSVLGFGISDQDWLIAKTKQVEKINGRSDTRHEHYYPGGNGYAARAGGAAQSPGHESAPRSSWGHVPEACTTACEAGPGGVGR